MSKTVDKKKKCEKVIVPKKFVEQPLVVLDLEAHYKQSLKEKMSEDQFEKLIEWAAVLKKQLGTYKAGEFQRRSLERIKQFAELLGYRWDKKKRSVPDVVLQSTEITNIESEDRRRRHRFELMMDWD